MNAPDSKSLRVEQLEFSEPPSSPADPHRTPLVRSDAEFLADVKVTLDARLGSAEISVSRLLSLKAGDTVSLNERLGDLVELRLNASTVARGELVAVGDVFGIRIVEISEHR